MVLRQYEAYDNSPIMYVIIDEKSNIVKYNNYALDYIELSYEQLNLLISSKIEYIVKQLKTKNNITLKIEIEEKKYILTAIKQENSYVIIHLIPDIKKSEPDNDEMIDFSLLLSHDARMHASTILMAEDLLKEKINDSKYNVYFEAIEYSCNEIIRMFNNIIDYSKICSGNIKLEKSNNEINSFINEIVDVCSKISYSKNINIVYKNINKKINIAFDNNLIYSLIFNLISNAVKFSYDEKDIIITLKETEKEIIIGIEDCGKIILSDEYEKIFDAYYTTRDKKGSGLGLAICKRIAALHGGKIWVEKSDEQSTIIEFSLPKVVVKDNKIRTYKPDELYEFAKRYLG